MSFSLTANDRTKYSLQRDKLCVGSVKIYSLKRDFVTAGLVIAGFVSTYFTVILPDFQKLFVITGCHCND